VEKEENLLSKEVNHHSFQHFPHSSSPNGLNMPFVHIFYVERWFLILLSINSGAFGIYWKTCIG
jgi:hypothetical protein